MTANAVESGAFCISLLFQKQPGHGTENAAVYKSDHLRQLMLQKPGILRDFY